MTPMLTDEAATTTSGFRGMYFAQQVKHWITVSTERLEIEKVHRTKNAAIRRLLQNEQTALPKINADLNRIKCCISADVNKQSSPGEKDKGQSAKSAIDGIFPAAMVDAMRQKQSMLGTHAINAANDGDT